MIRFVRIKKIRIYPEERIMLKRIMIIILVVFFVVQINGENTELKNGSLIEVNGVNLFVKEIGSGEPIFVLHGGPGMFHDYFLPHMEKLAKGKKLIFFDQRGNGKSLMELNSQNYSIENLVEDIEGLRKYYKLDKINLLGHSFGGLLSMQYAAVYPERVKSMVLMNTASASSEYLMRSMMNKQNKYTKDDIAQIGAITSSKEFMSADPETVEKFFRVAEKYSVHNPKFLDTVFSTPFTSVTARNLLIISQLAQQLFANYDLFEKLNKINCPTLIIHGEYDFILLESSRKIQENIKNSKLEILNNCAHYPFIETPEKLFSILEKFYKKNDFSDY